MEGIERIMILEQIMVASDQQKDFTFPGVILFPSALLFFNKKTQIKSWWNSNAIQIEAKIFNIQFLFYISLNRLP